ncbi:hypothetical protein [Enterobacteriaceae endosymbiont of Macroplea appendiculata]|uniref:hypothetical protein n=1 Tax=Enterobacteriaceae endosymbiont of Macroplea appendiculata TaxID=2675790 RepID=UPI001456847F|nr:hypothetical protein [Enterobacteriaceae endosymbiont of Macroplea appendiculata]
MKKKKILHFTKNIFMTLIKSIKLFLIMILITGLQCHIYANNLHSYKTKLITLHTHNTPTYLLNKNYYFILLNKIINIYYKLVSLTQIIINDMVKIIISPYYDKYHVNHITYMNYIVFPINNAILHSVKFIFLNKIKCIFVLIKNLMNVLIYHTQFSTFMINKHLKQTTSSLFYINDDIEQINIKQIYKNQINLINKINIFKILVTKTIKILWILQSHVNQISNKHIKNFQNNNVMILNNKYYIKIMTMVLNNHTTNNNISGNKKISCERLQLFKHIQPLEKYQKIVSVPVYYGKYRVIKVGLYENVYLTVLKKQEKNIHILYHVYNNKILAPIYKNQILGYMCFINKNHILKIYPLVALHNVPLGNFFIRFLDYVRLFLSKWLNQ